MSKLKKRLKKAAKIGIGLGAAYALMGGKKDAASELISGKDSEVGAIAATKKAPVRLAQLGESDAIMKDPKSPTFPKLEERKKFRSVRGGKRNFGMLSAADVRAKNAAQAERMKEAAKGKTRYSLFGSMGLAKGSKNAVTVMARGCKLGKKKETKIL